MSTTTNGQTLSGTGSNNFLNKGETSAEGNDTVLAAEEIDTQKGEEGHHIHSGEDPDETVDSDEGDDDSKEEVSAEGNDTVPATEERYPLSKLG